MAEKGVREEGRKEMKVRKV